MSSPRLASATACAVEESRTAPIWVSSTTTKTTMLYMTSVAPVRKRRAVGYARASRAVTAVSVGRSNRRRNGHSTTSWFWLINNTAEKVTSTPSAMYTVIDGVSKTSGLNRFAVSDHRRMPNDTIVHAPCALTQIRNSGTAASAASAGNRYIAAPVLFDTAMTAAAASRAERADDSITQRRGSFLVVALGRSRIAAITLSRLSRTLVTTTVRNAITKPAANPLIRLVPLSRNDRSSCCDCELHWFMIVSAIPTTPRPTSVPTSSPRNPATAA